MPIKHQLQGEIDTEMPENDCPVKADCRVTDKWCSAECYSKSEHHCFSRKVVKTK